MPDVLHRYYAVGSDDEATLCVADLFDPWHATPNAIAWLRAETRKKH